MTTKLWNRKSNAALWVAQGPLAALFGFAGYVKLAMPYTALDGQMGLPGWLLPLHRGGRAGGRAGARSYPVFCASGRG